MVGPGLACAQAGRRRCPQHWISGAGPPPVVSEVGFWIQLPPRASDASLPMPVGPPDDREQALSVPECLQCGLMTTGRHVTCLRATSEVPCP